MITTKGNKGSGLGLYMSYSTIKGNFNGNLTFESQEGVGSTFILTLPIKN
jgi:signal transduction histidine kinase